MKPLKLMQTIPSVFLTFLIRYKPSVCIKAVLEQTVLRHPLKHYLDNIALQEVICCYHNGEKKTTKEDRQTIITLKSGGLSFREIAKKPRCQWVQFPTPSKGTWKLEETLTGRGLADPKPQHNQKTSFWESAAFVIGDSQDSSFKHSLTLVEVRKSQFQLWREDFELQVWQVEWQ